jgi:MSHA type pilus biogenesis protein MshL
MKMRRTRTMQALVAICLDLGAALAVGATPSATAALPQTDSLAAPLPPPLTALAVPRRTSPLRAKMFSFAAREVALADVLQPVAAEAGLAIGWGKGVDPQTPLTVAFSNIHLEDALETIFAETEYSYAVDGRSLQVRAWDTRYFELGWVPTRTQSTMAVGGDVLGSMGESEGQQKADGPTGKFQVTGGTDDKAADLWAQVEDGLKLVLSPDGRYSINRLSGTVIVTDRKRNLDHAARFLDEVKRAIGRQVVVEVKVVEVGLDAKTASGVDWSALTTVATSKTPITLSGSQGLGLANSIFELTVAGKDGNLLLQALAEKGELNVLSQPRLNIMNGQTAVINVGKVVVYWELKGIAGGSLGGESAVFPEQRSVLVGILMGVTAYIASDGRVTMQIVPIITDLGDERQFEFQGATLRAPDLNIRGTSTTVAARDGDTVVIGGLLSTRKKTLQRKVPLLGDIPILGFFFKRDEEEESKVELALLLTPRVVNQ